MISKRAYNTPATERSAHYERNVRPFYVQHDAHVSAYIDHILCEIEKVLGITHYTLTDWYACGDQLV